jgi:hypothetical protein
MKMGRVTDGLEVGGKNLPGFSLEEHWVQPPLLPKRSG